MTPTTSSNEWNMELDSFLDPEIESMRYKNPIVIYHANCADGFSAAWVFHKVQPLIEQNFDFHPGVYNEPPPDCSDRIVYLVDFSYKPDVLKEILKVAYAVYILDHHKSAIEAIDNDKELTNLAARSAEFDLQPNECLLHLHLDMTQCGATIAWEHWQYVFQSNGIQRPLLLGHIEDRDLWKFKLPRTREISAAVFSYEYTFENWDKLMAADQVELLGISSAGAAIERKHHKDIKELLDVCKRYLEIGGYLVPAASLPYVYSSDAAHAMAKSHEAGTVFAACYWDTATHRVFSLRSCDNGMDVAAIAEQYGGGGHKHAAGFRVPRSHILATS